MLLNIGFAVRFFRSFEVFYGAAEVCGGAIWTFCWQLTRYWDGHSSTAMIGDSDNMFFGKSAWMKFLSRQEASYFSVQNNMLREWVRFKLISKPLEGSLDYALSVHFKIWSSNIPEFCNKPFQGLDIHLRLLCKIPRCTRTRIHLARKLIYLVWNGRSQYWTMSTPSTLCKCMFLLEVAFMAESLIWS